MDLECEDFTNDKNEELSRQENKLYEQDENELIGKNKIMMIYQKIQKINKIEHLLM